MKSSFSRRRFIAGAASACTAPLILPAGKLFGRDTPGKQVNIAVIGCGSRGSQVLLSNQPYTGVRFVAACDPFMDRARNFAEGLNRKYGTDACKPFRDFREILGRDDIDGVAVFTPDHWHVPAAMLAARHRKDMYVEKPLGVAMKWAWRLREEIVKNKVVFQYGTQQRSSKVFRQACDLVRNGYIGTIRNVDVWCPHLPTEKHMPVREEKVPEGFDYDLWTGPSMMAPYQPERVSNIGAWHCRGTALGFIAGWGAHPLDICQWGLDADRTGPVSYEGSGVVPADEDELYDTTRRWDIRCRYENGVNMRFMDTLTATPPVKAYHYLVREHGTVFHGDEGWIGVDRMGMYSHDNNKLRKQEFKASDRRLPVSDNHFQNFIDCMHSRAETISPFETALRSDTISHLSDIVVRTGSALKWDPAGEKITDDGGKAGDLLDRPVRDGFRF